MSVACDLEYFEKTLELTANDGIARSIRDYQKTSAKVTVGNDAFQPELTTRTPPDRRRGRASKRPRFFSPTKT